MKKSLLTLALAFGIVAAPFTTDILSSTAEAKPLPPRPAAREGLVPHRSTAEAKPLPPRPAAREGLVPHQVRIDNEIDSISARFGVAESTVKKFYNQGWGFKELRHAAFLSYATGKDMGAVLDLKTEYNRWPRVEYMLGLTPNDIKAAHDKNDAEYLSTVLGILWHG